MAKRKQPDKIFVCDFETTSKEQYDIEGRTKVWAWGVSDYADYALGLPEAEIKNRMIYGVNIESFFKFFEDEFKRMSKGTKSGGKDNRKKKYIRAYFHNLEFDGAFILDYLFNKKGNFMGIEDFTINKEFVNGKTTKRHFSHLANGTTNTIFHITIDSKKFKLEFRCSLKLLTVKVAKLPHARKDEFPIDYSLIRNYENPSDITEQELNYLFYDIYAVGKSLVDFHQIRGEFDFTASGAAHKCMKESLVDRKKRFPIIEYNLYKDLKNWYMGGYTYVNPKFKNKILHGVYSYDINSSYPGQMKRRPMPYGLPMKWHYTDDLSYEEWGKRHSRWDLRLYAIRVKNFKIKDGHIPFLSFSRGISRFTVSTSKNYLSEFENNGVDDSMLFLPSPEYEMFLKYYDAEYEIISCYGFRSKIGMYDTFIDEHYANKTRGKLEGNYALEKNSKLLLNSCYGKEAMNPVMDSSEFYFEDGVVKLRNIPAEDVEKDSDKYLPFSIFITSWARYQLHEFIQQNKDIFVYSDTDSVKTVGEPNVEGIEIHDTNIGAWGFEYVTKDFKALCAKRYAFYDQKDKFHITCAGFSMKDDLVKSMDDFELGKVFPTGKKKMKSVPGGKILVEGPFTLNDV